MSWRFRIDSTQQPGGSQLLKRSLRFCETNTPTRELLVLTAVVTVKQATDEHIASQSILSLAVSSLLLELDISIGNSRLGNGVHTESSPGSHRHRAGATAQWAKATSLASNHVGPRTARGRPGRELLFPVGPLRHAPVPGTRCCCTLDGCLP